MMEYLLGLQEYLDAAYQHSVFDQALHSQQPWELHLHGCRVVKARILENTTYDLKVDMEGQGKEDLPKIQVKLLYPADLSESVRTLLNIDAAIKALGLQPILAPAERHFVKNKTLFPLMKEHQEVFFTLLEGEIIRGLVAGFSRYDIVVNLQENVPITILRHSIYNLQDQHGRCYLKSFQDKHKDWQKSDLFVHAPEPTRKPASATGRAARSSHHAVGGLVSRLAKYFGLTRSRHSTRRARARRRARRRRR
jgi:sRNA-binding regulator protein Hfq